MLLSSNDKMERIVIVSQYLHSCRRHPRRPRHIRHLRLRRRSRETSDLNENSIPRYHERPEASPEYILGDFARRYNASSLIAIFIEASEQAREKRYRRRKVNGNGKY